MSGFGRRTRDIETYRPADHQFGQIRFGKIRWVAAAHNLALTQHVYMICNFKDFMQFMGDKYYGFSSVAQCPVGGAGAPKGK